MKKTIIKKVLIDEDMITITLEDTRDSYIYEDALGMIGRIYLSPSGMAIYPHYDYDEKINYLKNQKLYQSFKEIFNLKEYNPLSGEYYNKIKTMIENGTLTKLGYAIENDDISLSEYQNYDYNEEIPNLKILEEKSTHHKR